MNVKARADLAQGNNSDKLITSIKNWQTADPMKLHHERRFVNRLIFVTIGKIPGHDLAYASAGGIIAFSGKAHGNIAVGKYAGEARTVAHWNDIHV
jgi:hypothetical protein